MRLDLREWLETVEELVQLARIDGADWNLEIGAITEASIRRLNGGPAILFDRIPGAPAGFRVLTNSNASIARISVTHDLPVCKTYPELIAGFRSKLQGIRPVAPRVVPT